MKIEERNEVNWKFSKYKKKKILMARNYYHCLNWRVFMIMQNVSDDDKVTVQF